MVRLEKHELQLLWEISNARKDANEINKTYKAIVTDLIRKAHKKECKKCK